MLSGQQFYWRTIRRNVVAFGTMFKDLQLVTYSNDEARNELKRITVPLIYGGKEDYFVRLKEAGTLPIPTDMPLPRMQFSLRALNYDASRKQQSLLQQFATMGSNNQILSSFIQVPWNLSFELQVTVRNTEDGLQIIEQILPYFTPEYTLQMSFVDIMGLQKNIPIVLESVDWHVENEGATDWTMRSEVWTLNFTMQTYLFGPVNQSSVIRSANVRIWYDAGAQTSGTPLQLTLAGPGFLTYQIGETIYQGNSLPEATAVGTVEGFYPSQNLLEIYTTSGTWVTNANVYGTNTQASWNVSGLPTAVPLAILTANVYPSNVAVGDDFGFTVTVSETPNT